MTDKDKHYIVVVVDKSGSMQQTKADAEGGLKHFLEALKETPGTKIISLFHFNERIGAVYEDVELSRVPDYTLEPTGGTALLDAIGHTIASVGYKLAQLPEDERPGDVVILVVTDGHENSSRDYRPEMIKEMIEHQRSKYGWTFIFIGAEQDAITAARKLGIPQETSLRYEGAATTDMFTATADMVSRGTTTGSYAYNQDERNSASGLKP